MKNLIFNVSGGIGKHIMFSAVIAAVRKARPEDKIIVLAAWPEPLLHNPNIDRVYRAGVTPYLYEDYIEGKDSEVFLHDPYHCTNYITKSEHLIKTWCDLVDVPYNGELPQLFLTPSEIDIAAYRTQRSKPTMVIQTNGGADGQPNPMSWMRDLPNHVAQQVVNHYAQQYHIFHLRRENQPQLANTEQLSMPLRELMASLMFMNKKLLIDSFPQHACAALQTPATVCWIGNKPNVFGYELHNNIVAATPSGFRHKPDAAFELYNITGNTFENPYQDFNYFNAEQLIQALE